MYMFKRLSTLSKILFGMVVLAATQISPASASGAGDIIVQINPSEQNLELHPGETYHGSFKVENLGTLPFSFTVSMRPYQVVGEDYDPDFYTQNDYTKISNWISFDQTNYHLEAGATQKIDYTINVPANVPGGGQYGAIIVETRDGTNPNSTVSVVSQLASIIYAHVAGEEHIGGVVEAHSLPSFLLSSPFTARVTIKNDGNVDFRATHTLAVYNFFTNQEVFSPDAVSSEGVNVGRASPMILPATTRANALTWAGAPQLGLFRAVQTVSFLDQEYTYEQIVFICPIWLVGLVIFFIALMVIWIIIRVHQRKRSRPQSF